MRVELVVVGVMVLSSSAEAKYEPCGSLAEFYEPPARVPRNAKVWFWNSTGEEQLRISGGGIDRVIARPLRRPITRLAYLDPGLLDPDQTYDIGLVGQDFRYSFGELTTTSDEDHEPPRAPEFRALAITQMIDPGQPEPPDWYRSGPASDIVLKLELSDDTLALDISYDDSSVHELVPREDIGMLGRNACGSHRTFQIGARTCMSIQAIDVAGNRSAPLTRCATVAAGFGDTSRTVHLHTWPRRQRPPTRPSYGWLVVAAFAAWLAHRGCRDGRTIAVV